MTISEGAAILILPGAGGCSRCAGTVLPEWSEEHKQEKSATTKKWEPVPLINTGTSDFERDLVAHPVKRILGKKG